MIRFTRTLLSAIFIVGFLSVVLTVSLGLAIAKREAATLPSLEGLSSRASAATSIMFDRDGREVGRFAEENRIPVQLNQIPPLLIGAFISAEDRNYAHHRGVDPIAIFRAVLQNARSMGTGRRPVGASTITQQVAKNLLVGDDRSLTRKLREMLVALRMDRELGKDRVLELYLNEIFLGEGAYGVAAAADAWFGRPMSELSIAEMAFLAGLPKAPSAYHPRRRPEASRARRAYVIGRMLEDGRITPEQARAALAAPLPEPRGIRLGNAAEGWFPEEARREVVNRLGAEVLYRGGLRVRTSLDPQVQAIVEQALRDGLVAFDRRSGWRGPLGFVPNVRADRPETWVLPLSAMEIPNGAGNWRMGLVLGMDRNGSAVVGHADGTWDLLTLDGVRWARRVTARGLGNPPRRVDEVVRTGDVILVSREGNRLELRQIPEIQGSAIIMEASSGRVLGVAGGFDSEMGRFNRATQGRRQPGSTFKTLTYMAAFEAGYDPTSPVLDSPIALDTGPNQRWRPEGGGAMGLITLRRALELSRNLSSVRLLNDIGIEAVSDLSRRLGVYDRPLTNFAAGLGAVETTNMRLTAAYASIVNGGFRVNPGFVDEVLDQSGRVLWSRNRERERVLDPIASAQMVSVLEGVVRRGTGAAVLGRLQLPIAGKTGTTNDNHDAWFVGFTPEYAIGVHIGYDRPRDMGSLETGGRAAAPIFGDIARGVLSIRPGPTEFPLPHGAEVQRIDPVTGEQSRNGIPEIRRRP